MTSNTGPFLVFPRIQPFGPVDLSSRGKVYSRHATGSVNCENSSVSFVMNYCLTSTVVRHPASVQIFITRSCCESLSTRSLYFCNIFLVRELQSKVLSLTILLVEQWVRLSCQHGSLRSCMTSTVFVTQI